MNDLTSLLGKMPVARTIDDVIGEIPLNRFHYVLLVLCGLGFCVDAMEVVILGFISSCAGVEFALTNDEIASITSSVFIGALIGSLTWGPIADRYGRRICYMASIITTLIGAWLSGFAPSFGWLVTLRFIVGIGVGGATVPFDIFAEFLPPHARGRSLMLVNAFWSVGAIFVTLMAMVTIPRWGWQGLVFITAVPVTLCALVAVFILPESPRWLISQGRYGEAHAIVMDAAKDSGVKLDSFFFDKHSLGLGTQVQLADREFSGTAPAPAPAAAVDQYKSTGLRAVFATIGNGLLETYQQYKSFLGDKSLAVRTLKVGGIWFIFGLTYYGVVLLVTRMYGESSGAKSSSSSATCSFDYGDIAVNTSAEFIGLAISTLTIDSMGRRATQGGMYLLGAAALLILGLLRGESQHAVLVLGYIARLAAMGASCSTWVVTPELYPTRVRATAHSFLNSIARLGAFLSPWIVSSSLSTLAVALILGSCNSLAAALAFSLEETKGQDLDCCAPDPHEGKEASLLSGSAITDSAGNTIDSVPSPLLAKFSEADTVHPT